MGDIVVAVVKACLSCTRVKARFRKFGKEFKPLPTKGLGRSAPLQKTIARNEWVIACIEHFTKWVELIPLPSKSSREPVRGFLGGVLNRHVAQGEVLAY